MSIYRTIAFVKKCTINPMYILVLMISVMLFNKRDPKITIKQDEKRGVIKALGNTIYLKISLFQV